MRRGAAHPVCARITHENSRHGVQPPEQRWVATAIVARIDELFAIDSGLAGNDHGLHPRDGSVLWDFDTAQEFQTTNGLRAHGGSLNGAAPAVLSGTLYVNTGYTNARAGNVLLAFALDPADVQ